MTRFFLLALLSITTLSSAFANESEVNCERVNFINKNQESVYIDFRRTDLFAPPLAIDDQILAIGEPLNPHANYIGVASFYVKKISEIDRKYKTVTSSNGTRYSVKDIIYGIKFEIEGYLVKSLKLKSKYTYTICTETVVKPL